MSNGIEKIVQRLGGKAEQSLTTETYGFLERNKRESGWLKQNLRLNEKNNEIQVKNS